MPQANAQPSTFTLVIDPGGPKERRVTTQGYWIKGRRVPEIDPARRKIENAIERHLTIAENLIAFIDNLDGDADREPSLSGNGVNDDREGAADDLEPSLGSLSSQYDQARWASGRNDDTEEEHDGSEEEDIGAW